MDNQALDILKLFYNGAPSVRDISNKTKLAPEEVREILKGARTCGLISFNTQDQAETFHNIKKKKLELYLRSKGALK
ncbi:MAG: hypothetical protein ATN36_08265 [Epulopiscium sp. Nele67-Bin005]|nr:MAG: hypothetical protein ATN36_08265 [Epulopiscium sp. Nele67-Bin005]